MTVLKVTNIFHQLQDHCKTKTILSKGSKYIIAMAPNECLPSKWHPWGKSRHPANTIIVDAKTSSLNKIFHIWERGL